MKVKKRIYEAVTGLREVLLDPPEDGEEPELDLSEALTDPREVLLDPPEDGEEPELDLSEALTDPREVLLDPPKDGEEPGVAVHKASVFPTHKQRLRTEIIDDDPIMIKFVSTFPSSAVETYATLL
jgi:hypothetical protein